MVSQQLVEQWRVRLAAWQQRLDEDRPRPWLARAYVRVLKFLLAQYSAGDDETNRIATRLSESVADAAAPRDRSAMRFEAVSPELAGKPPRSREDIRSALESVKAKVPQVEQGPLADGLQPDDPIVVAVFYHPRLASGLRAQLKAEGIESRSKLFRRQTQVVVRAGDHERARPIVASHAAVARDRLRPPVQYARLFLSFGAVVGAMLGGVAAIVLGAPNIPSVIALALLFAFPLSLVGLVVGTIVDG
jgi:hypothetical protein